MNDNVLENKLSLSPIISKKNKFVRNGVELYTQYCPGAVEAYLGLFSTRTNYLCMPLNKEGEIKKDERSKKISFTRSFNKQFKDKKLVEALNDKMIIDALEGSTWYMYGVRFKKAYKDPDTGEWIKTDCKISYFLLDIDGDSIYRNKLEIVEAAFSKYGATICWIESSATGVHGYVWLPEEVAPYAVASFIEYVCSAENLGKRQPGTIEWFPNRRSDKSKAYLPHRLPCQRADCESGAKFSKNVEVFMAEREAKISTALTEEYLEDLFKQSNSNKTYGSDRFLQKFINGFPGKNSGNVIYNACMYHRIYSFNNKEKSVAAKYKTQDELVVLCREVIEGLPNFATSCSKQGKALQDEIEACVAKCWDLYKPYEGREYTKRKEKSYEIREKLPALLDNPEYLKKDGSPKISKIAKELNCRFERIQKLVEFMKRHPVVEFVTRPNITWKDLIDFSKSAQQKVFPIHHTSSLRSKELTSICESGREDCALLEQIKDFSVNDLESTLSKAGIVKVSSVAKLLNCHRNSLPNKTELTKIVLEVIKTKDKTAKEVKLLSEPNVTAKITPSKPEVDKVVVEQKQRLKTPIFSEQEKHWKERINLMRTIGEDPEELFNDPECPSYKYRYLLND